MMKWGLCADEFHASGHWPPALYVRSARRLVGDRVFTQNTPAAQRAQGSIGELSIGVGCYNFDSHNAERWACANVSACEGAGPVGVAPETAYIWNEGDVETAPGMYQIPLWVILPSTNATQAAAAGHRVPRNLLVIAAPSATHIGMSTLRMEPVFMIIGHSAGVVAALASVSPAHDVHAINATALHAALLADGQILTTEAPNAYGYACEAARCVQLSTPPDAAHPADAACGGECDALAQSEWLALKEFFQWDGHASLLVSITDTFLKKSEVHSSLLPRSQLLAVTKGQTIPLTRPPVSADGKYLLVSLDL